MVSCNGGEKRELILVTSRGLKGQTVALSLDLTTSLSKITSHLIILFHVPLARKLLHFGPRLSTYRSQWASSLGYISNQFRRLTLKWPHLSFACAGTLTYLFSWISFTKPNYNYATVMVAAQPLDRYIPLTTPSSLSPSLRGFRSINSLTTLVDSSVRPVVLMSLLIQSQAGSSMLPPDCWSRSSQSKRLSIGSSAKLAMGD